MYVRISSLLFKPELRSEIGAIDVNPGRVLKEILGGDVPLRPWNPKPILELVQLNFATLY